MKFWKGLWKFLAFCAALCGALYLALENLESIKKFLGISDVSSEYDDYVD